MKLNAKRFIVLVVTVIILLICFRFLYTVATSISVSREEIVRVTSPDSVVDAVLVRTDGGATTSFGFHLYIVPVGGEPQVGHELFTADHMVGQKIEWKRPKSLEIQYEEARIFHFSNFWQSKDVQNFGYVVELHLKPLNPSSLNPKDRRTE